MNAIDRPQLQTMLEAAKIKQRIRRDLRFVPEEITNWDDRDFIAIMNRSRSEGVLIAPLNVSYVISIRLQQRMSNSSGRTEPITCDICMTWQRGSNSAIITFDRQKTSTSFLCCANLLCSLHVRDKTAQALLSRTQLRETNTEHDRIMRLQSSLQRILKEAHTLPYN